MEYLFANAGTDFAPLIEGLARASSAGLAMPTPLVVPHESAAIAMAHGYYLATGRPQDIERMGRRLRLFRDAASPGRPEDHTTQLWLVDASGRMMQRYAGSSADMTRLAGEIGQLRDLGSGSG